MYETSSIQKTFTNNMYCYILISFKKIIILTVGLIFCLLFYFISVHGKPGVREGENVSEETGGELHTESCIVASSNLFPPPGDGKMRDPGNEVGVSLEHNPPIILHHSIMACVSF